MAPGYLRWTELRRLGWLDRARLEVRRTLARLRDDFSQDGLRRSGAMLLSLLLTILTTGALVIQKEIQILRGRTVYLELVPADPRSLMQGDYMALAYRFTNRDVEGSGRLVLEVDSRQVGHCGPIVQLYSEGDAIEPDHILIRYRTRGGRLLIGAESFFFQEGQASAYAKARFAEIRVTPEGDCVLVALCDADLQRIGSRRGEGDGAALREEPA